MIKKRSKPIWKIVGIAIVLVMVVSGVVVGAGPVNNANCSSVNVSDSNAVKYRISTENAGMSDYGIKWNEEDPELYVHPTYLDFGVMKIGETAWDSFYVENTGGDTLEWEADCDFWIKVYPSSGSLWGGDSHEVEVEIDTTDLEGGETYDGSIYLTSNGGDGEVHVEVYVVEPPELYVYPTYLDFGVMGIGETAWDSFSVWNEGEDTLEWEAYWDMGWIDVYPSSGSLWGGDSHEVEVEIDTTDLESGEFYDGYIYLASNGGDAEVYVEVQIDGSPPIYYPPVASFSYTYLSPITIMFDASRSYDNDGFIIEYNWDFGDGVTGTGVTYNHTYIANGTYNVKLTVTDNDYLTNITTWNVTINNITAYDVCDFVNDIGLENLTLAHVSFLIDLFIGLNSSVLDHVPPEHRPNGIIKNLTEDDINAVGAYYCGNIVFGNYYANKSCGRVCCESNTTGLVLARKNSSVEDAAQKVAIGKEWEFLAVNTKDPVDIKKKIKAEYDKEPFEYLLIIGNDTEIPLEDKWDLVHNEYTSSHVLDSLYYGNMNDDFFVEVSAGRIPFHNEDAIKHYFDNFEVGGTQNYYFKYIGTCHTYPPFVGTSLSVEFDNTTTSLPVPKEELIECLKDARVFTIYTHGGEDSWHLGDDYGCFTKSDIPDINLTRPIIISDSCYTTRGLGVDFLKAGASAFIGEYFVFGGTGRIMPLILNKKILSGNSIGNSVRDYLNCRIAVGAINHWDYPSASSATFDCNVTIVNVDIHNSTVIPDAQTLMLGDPSLKIPAVTSNLENATVKKKYGILLVKIPTPHVTVLDNDPDNPLVVLSYGGENEVEKYGVILKATWDEIINEGRDWGIISQFAFPIENVNTVNSGVEIINGTEFELKSACSPSGTIGIPFVSIVKGESLNFLVISEKMLDSSAFFNQREIILNVTVSEKAVFDTEAPANPYPSILGTHNGTIIPNVTIEVSKLYTYPCVGTGGHTEYARIWNSSGLDVSASWSGYISDWHNISFNKTFTLLANETYNYTIRTGSYPQIHHTPALPTANGWINCTEFTDTNGKSYNDWIPSIRLFL